VNFIQMLQGIPAPAWGLAGAIVGVFGALGANALSNGSNDRRFERQLKHDSEQKSKDRAAELRRSVHLSAAEELVAINAFLGQLASLDPTDTQAISGGMLGFFKATAKVQVVGGKGVRKTGVRVDFLHSPKKVHSDPCFHVSTLSAAST